MQLAHMCCNRQKSDKLVPQQDFSTGTELISNREHSFHTNRRATEWLLHDSNLRKMAEAEAKVIADYFGVSKTVQPPSETPRPADGSFKVRIICAELNVRASAGVQYPVRMTVSRNEVYTIVQTARTSDGGTWGRLKSGADWINIGTKYVKRI